MVAVVDDGLKDMYLELFKDIKMKYGSMAPDCTFFDYHGSFEYSMGGDLDFRLDSFNN